MALISIGHWLETRRGRPVMTDPPHCNSTTMHSTTMHRHYSYSHTTSTVDTKATAIVDTIVTATPPFHWTPELGHMSDGTGSILHWTGPTLYWTNISAH